LKEKPALIRAIGSAGIALIVLNSMIGAGIFATPGSVAAQAGDFSPWLYLGIGIVFVTVVLSFAELSSYFRESGGPVLFAKTAFGPLAGFSSGWLLYISRLSSFAANTTAVAIYVGELWPWVGTGNGRITFMSVVCVGLTVANYVGVKDGIRTLAVFTFLKITPIVILVLLGLKEVTGDVLLPSNLPTIDDFGGLTLLIIYAFIGFEVATVVSGETRHPRRRMPRAILATVIGTSVLYFLIMLVYVSVLPEGERMAVSDDGELVPKTLAHVGRVLAGGFGAIAIALAAIFSIGGNLASTMLSVPRLSFALGEQGLLPAWFGQVHPRFHTPGNSVLLFGAFCLLLALTGTFALLAGAASLARMLVYAISIAGLPVIRRQATAEVAERAFRLPFGYLIPVIAMALCIWIASNSPFDVWKLALGQLAVGLVLYAVARK
jgi:basic amino acid/polyamine antiporter, APA family